MGYKETKMSENEKTELKFLGGLFRNESKKGDIYYSGKSEDGTQWVYLGTHTGKKVKLTNLTLDSTQEFQSVRRHLRHRTDGI